MQLLRCSSTSSLSPSYACLKHQVRLAAPQRNVQVLANSLQRDSDEVSSDGFANNLRRGFTPQKRTASSQGADSNSASAGLPTIGNKVLIGNDMSEETWREMDKKINKYPGYRTFTAIGSGGDEFKASMVQAVERAVGPVHVECVSQRPSSKGQYLSVRIGPVVVQTPEQVIQVFANMREDSRLKWYM